jgi:cbb3-type cytochrome oxidase subunit 3
MSASLGMSMPELALLFFFSLFVGLVIWLAFSRSKRWERIARIPLNESVHPSSDESGRASHQDDAVNDGGSRHAD